MNSSPPPPPVRAPGDPLARPRDAATLIVYRENAGVLEVLMGERHARHRFMPHRFVFPGGRIDARDSRVRCATPLAPGTSARLERRLGPARARAMAVAAIRETFEETGLIVGGPDPDPRRPPPRGWEGFFAAGFAPALGALAYVARAVTPPIRPVRFNARFFVVAHEHVTGQVRGSGELLGLKWFAVEEALTLELAQITRRVLIHFGASYGDVAGTGDDGPVPYFKWTPTGHVLIDE
ncbi:MAG: NUDIX hydrolase [Defluviicoccus sp.]|nr:NUDIX hydrolase [Defluviicoccus sp.]